jgi:hypothetical protein
VFTFHLSAEEERRKEKKMLIDYFFFLCAARLLLSLSLVLGLQKRKPIQTSIEVKWVKTSEASQPASQPSS